MHHQVLQKSSLETYTYIRKDKKWPFRLNLTDA